MQRKLFLLLLLIAFSSHTFAQEAVPSRPSPLAIAACKYKDSYLKITYSQPHKRGREIFGTLVPYGQVWRLGANEATELTITREVFINGQFLPAGTYSLFAIPDKEKWTIIVSKDVGTLGIIQLQPGQRRDAYRSCFHALPGDLVTNHLQSPSIRRTIRHIL
ncbi:MAG: DUF2911 domain-containing protein [Bacteroidota bacterium]